MPFDVRDFPDAPPGDHASSQTSRRMVAIWLLTVAGMIFVMIVLGGATRISGSGLSIMEWAPLSGALPPMSDAEWHRLFALYQQIPQYELVNHGFGLDGFKRIFWLEWTHRLWGRLIGVVFLLPLVALAATRRIERRLLPRLVLVFALGGLQGAVGWFMVASGFFPNATSVSGYRLVVHLALALLLYAAILWTAMGLLRAPIEPPPPRRLPILAAFTACLVALTIVAGGFVAGIHAGLDYNTFPLMDGRLVPDGYARLTPLLRNITENIAAVQFDHRLLATLTVLAVAMTLAAGFTTPRPARPTARLVFLGCAAALQYLLGVVTLLTVVPFDLATAHQAGAVLLLTAVLLLLHGVRRTRTR